MRDDWQRYAIAVAIIIAIILIVAFASLAARYWFRWVRCPACRTTPAVDLRVLDRHGDVDQLHPRIVVTLCYLITRSRNIQYPLYFSICELRDIAGAVVPPRLRAS